MKKTPTKPAEQQSAQARILPLWKSALAEMRKQEICYGRTYEAAWFEEQLSCERTSIEFSISISEIRRELEKDGFYLSGRGQKGDQFVILPPEDNAKQMLRYQYAALDALKRGVILGTNTRLDALTDAADRRRHEAVLERMANKAALMNRRAPLLKDTPPQLKRPSR